MSGETHASSAGRPATWIRAFVAVPLPDEVKTALGRVQREVQSSLPGDAVRWTPPEQIHLTLRFLGDVPADSAADVETALRRAGAGIAPFPLGASDVGVFPTEARPRVLWVGLRGELDALRRLHAQIARETATWGERAEREFHPHLTLGRVKSVRPAGVRAIEPALERVNAGDLGSWRVERVDLMRSQLSQTGATHTCLAGVPLAG